MSGDSKNMNENAGTTPPVTTVTTVTSSVCNGESRESTGGFNSDTPVTGSDAVTATPPSKPSAALALEVAPVAPQADSEATRARVRDAAKAIDPKKRRDRVRFLAGLGPDFERGVTTEICAEVWGLAPNTVTHDATIAMMMIGGRQDSEVDHALWWDEQWAALERAKEHRDYVAKLLEAAGLPLFTANSGKKFTDWKGVTAHAQALAACHEQINRPLEQLSRALGLSGRPMVAVNILNPTTHADRQLKAQLDERDDVLIGAMEQALEELVADRGLRGRVLGRVAELIQPRPPALLVTAEEPASQ